MPQSFLIPAPMMSMTAGSTSFCNAEMMSTGGLALILRIQESAGDFAEIIRNVKYALLSVAMRTIPSAFLCQALLSLDPQRYSARSIISPDAFGSGCFPPEVTDLDRFLTFVL
jgi:hypothetical protein